MVGEGVVFEGHLVTNCTLSVSIFLMDCLGCVGEDGRQMRKLADVRVQTRAMRLDYHLSSATHYHSLPLIAIYHPSTTNPTTAHYHLSHARGR